MLIESILHSAIIPAVIATTVGLLSLLLPTSLAKPVRLLTVALCFLYSYYELLGWPPFPPEGGVDSLPYVIIWASFYFILDGRGFLLRYFFRWVWLVVAAYSLLWPLMLDLQSSVVFQRNALAFFLVGVGTWGLAERGEKMVHPFVFYSVLAVMFALMSGFFIMKSSGLLSQLVVAFGLIMGLMALASGLRPRLAVGLPSVASTAFMGFLMCGHFYLSINPWHLSIFLIPWVLLYLRPYLSFFPRNVLADGVVSVVVSCTPLLGLIFYVA